MKKFFNNSKKIINVFISYHLLGSIHDFSNNSNTYLPTNSDKINSIDNIIITDDDEYILVIQTAGDIGSTKITTIFHTLYPTVEKTIIVNTLGVIKILGGWFIVSPMNIIGIKTGKDYGIWAENPGVKEVAVLENRILYFEPSNICISYVNIVSGEMEFPKIEYNCDGSYESPTWINDNTFLFVDSSEKNKMIIFKLDHNQISVMKYLTINGASINTLPKITCNGQSVYIQYGTKMVIFHEIFELYNKHENKNLPEKLKYCKYDHKFYDNNMESYNI
jgi:hypothetical protein